MFSDSLFWIMFSVSLFCPLLIALICNYSYRKRIVWSVVSILIALLLATGIYGMQEIDTENWNDDKCKICSGEMNFSTITSGRYNAGRVCYTCNECGHTEGFPDS